MYGINSPLQKNVGVVMNRIKLAKLLTIVSVPGLFLNLCWLIFLDYINVDQGIWSKTFVGFAILFVCAMALTPESTNNKVRNLP